MGRPCSTGEGSEKCIQYLSENLNGRDHLEKLSVDGMKALKLTGLNWLGI
jgi:hypothetical protein